MSFSIPSLQSATPRNSGEMAVLIRTHNWAATPLGPAEAWPQSLRTVVELILAMPQPAWVCWGPDLRLLYNDEYITILGSRHPDALGCPWDTVWPDVPDALRPASGEIGAGAPHRLAGAESEPGVRRAALSSRWFTSTMAPLRDDDGKIAGLFGVAMETAERTLSEREREETRHTQGTEEARWAQELNRSRELLRATMDSSMDMIQVFEAVRDETGDIVDFRWILNNHASEAIYGDVIGQSLLQHNPGVIEEGIFDTFKRVVETGEPNRSEHYYVHEQFNGWFYQATVKLGDGVATTTTDITRIKAAEEKIRHLSAERQAFLLELSDSLRPLRDPAEIMATVSEEVGRYLEVGRCGYAEAPPPYDHLVVVQDWTDGAMDSMQGTWPLASFGDAVIAAYRSGQTVVFEDVFNDDRVRGSEASAEAGSVARSIIAVQLMKEGEWVATFFVQNIEPRHWTDDEIALMEDIAERTWTAVERARAEQALRQSEERNIFLIRFTDTVRGLSDPARIAEEACRLLTQQLGTEQTYWAVVDWETREYAVQYLVVAGDRSVEPIRWPLDPRDPFAAEHLAGRSVVYVDTERESRIPDLAKVAMIERGMRSGIAVPVMVGGTLGALLNTSQSTPRYWSPAEVAFVEALAERAWAEIERARAEAALRESEENFRNIANVVPDLLWYGGSGGSTTWYNQRWMEYTGQTFEQAIGWGWMDAIHPDDRETSARRYCEAVEQCRPLQQEHRIRRHDGEYRWFLVRTQPLPDERGRVIRMYGSATDIHEERTARDELQQFFSSLSHELQTPLTSIRAGLGLLDAAIGETLGAGEKGLLEATRRNVERLRLQINQLLTASQLTTTGLRADLAVVDLRQLVVDAIEAIRPLLQEKGQVAAVDMPELLEVEGDSRLLEHVLANLLSNANRHTPPGTRIVISGWFVDGEVWLTVHNNGPTIPSHELDTIFRRFYRADGTQREGIGLGLAIARDAVEAQGGRIWAESDPEQGTTFFVVLPHAPWRSSE